MKNLIVQIYVDTKKYENPNLLPSFDELSTTSFTLAKHYAEEIGADYLLLTDAYINYVDTGQIIDMALRKKVLMLEFL